MDRTLWQEEGWTVMHPSRLEEEGSLTLGDIVREKPRGRGSDGATYYRTYAETREAVVRLLTKGRDHAQEMIDILTRQGTAANAAELELEQRRLRNAQRGLELLQATPGVQAHPGYGYT